jgi:Protein of unknown function (DUF2889)
MLNKMIEKQSKIHTRNISLTTYPCTRDRVLVQGSLKDQRYIPVFDITGKVRSPGTVHHMSVTLLIAPAPLTIVQAEAEMLTVPMAECPATLDLVEQLEGVEIKSGFSNQIRKIMGGNRGCTHLCTLVVAMGQEIFHGWLTQKRSRKTPLPVSLDAVQEKGFLIDSCRMWKKDGPKIQEMQQAFEKQ